MKLKPRWALILAVIYVAIVMQIPSLELQTAVLGLTGLAMVIAIYITNRR